MSEHKVYDDGQNQVYMVDTNLTAAQMRAGANPFKEPDSAVAAVDAFRAAIVAQTALLRGLVEQTETQRQAIKSMGEAIIEFAKSDSANMVDLGKGVAGLAERLEKQASWLEAIQHRQENILGQIRTANQAYSDGMASAQGKHNQSLTSKKSKQGRRKAKR